MPQTLKTLTAERDSRGVLSVTLNRPDVKNAFNEVLIEEITHVFDEHCKDPETRLVVLSGAGSTFCAGGDLNWMKRAASMSRDENLRDALALTRMFAHLNEFPKPIIGAVQGAAIGGGVGFVSICDLVVAEPATVFSLSEVRLGLVPACIGPFVISKIGGSQARALFMSAERFGAQRALQVGLIHEIAPTLQELPTVIEKKIENMLQCSPNALTAAKKLILNLSWPEKRAHMHDTLGYVSEMLADLRVSVEGQEGVRAFLEKRKPSWMN